MERWDRYRYISEGLSWGPSDSPVAITFELRGEVGFPVPVVDREGAAAWLERILGARTPGQATVVFNSFVLQYLAEEELTAFQRCLEAAGERATENEPLAWLRMEHGGEWAGVRLQTWPDGHDRQLARAGYHGTPVLLTPTIAPSSGTRA